MAKPVSTWGLGASLVLYLGLCLSTVRAVGVVGEVAIAGALDRPPTVLVGLDPPEEGISRWGPLVARPTRPTEVLELGPLQVPLAVNAYTGGPADWPARLLNAVAGPAAAAWTGVGLGALLLILAHRFLRFHGSDGAPTAAALCLASDWSFVFYRKVLGGTEVLLQAASLLLVWALWSRRWKGGVHGTVAIALGIGLGLLAKVTFLGSLLAIGTGVLLTRWDRAPLRPPSSIRSLWLLLLPLACISPLLIAAIHHQVLPSFPSHDGLGLQWQRLLAGWQGSHADREGWSNLLYFLGNPLGFFEAAYGTAPQPPLSLLRSLGLLLTLAGSLLAWRDPQTPAAALLRFLSLVVPLQILLLFLLNHDLHHLAQSTVLLALWSGLAADRLAATRAPRGMLRSLLACLLVLPNIASGILHLRATDAIVEQIPVPTFTAAGQAALVEMLRRNGVEDLVVADYESYGMLEVLAPEIRVTHAWGAMAIHHSGKEILRYARGRYLLSVQASMPMIYNWDPEPEALKSTATAAGVTVEAVDSLNWQGKERAWLWKVAP